MITLLLFFRESINSNAIFLASLPLFAYMISEKLVVKKVSDIKFDSLITSLILSYGILSFIEIG